MKQFFVLFWFFCHFQQNMKMIDTRVLIKAAIHIVIVFRLRGKPTKAFGYNHRKE